MSESEAPNNKPPLPRAKSSQLLAIWRTMLILVGSIGLGALLAIRLCFTASRSSRLAVSARACRLWCRMCLRAIGVRRETFGPPPQGASILAPNHIGYMDVLAVGASLPCFFITRTEVSRWPLVSHLVKLSHQIVINRSVGRHIRDEIAAVTDRLLEGHPICIFLEGTSTGGDRILPFRGAMLQAAIEAKAPVTPIGIHWRSDSSDIELAEDIAYWKDHVFGPHIWRLLGLRGLRVEVRFGEPVEAGELDRKEFASAARLAVADLAGLPRELQRDWRAESIESATQTMA